MAQMMGMGPDTLRDRTVYDPTRGSRSHLLDGCAGAEIQRGNTLAAPQRTAGPGRLKRFDCAATRTLFSARPSSNGLDSASDEFRRLGHGEMPYCAAWSGGAVGLPANLFQGIRPWGGPACIVACKCVNRGESAKIAS